MKWKLEYTKQAQRDAKRVAAGGLRHKVEQLLDLIADDPFAFPPPFEHLQGEMHGAIARRINKQHRLVDMVFSVERIIRVLRMWTHYE